MKKQHILFLLLAVFIFAACNNNTDDIEHNGRTPVKFSSHISVGPKTLQTRAVDNKWDANDAIGVYMLESGGTIIAENAENKKYLAENTGMNTSFRADTENIIYFPDNGNSVDFIAYYPFNLDIQNNLYKINVEQQADQLALDLMATNKVEGKSKTDADVNLEFRHILSKLILNVSSTDILYNRKIELYKFLK